jgi:small subunit ribosomal protein S1
MSLEEKASGLQQASTELEQPGSTDPIANVPEAGEVMSLLAGMDTLSPPPVVQGEIVQGRVLKVTESEVLVDIGLKSEAALPRSEFLNEEGQLTVAPGNLIGLWVEQYDELTGNISVSYQRALRRKHWEEIEHAFRDQTPLQGRVVDRIKGGLAVDIGIRAFLPASHADLRPHSNLDGLLGQEISCKVIRINRKRNNVIVSRRLAIEDELNRARAELAERLVEGAELQGKVKNLTDYGVFVDLGGLDGLLHITDLSWGRVGHPSEVVQVGQEIRVKVLKHDREKGRVSLGLKQLTPDPWENVEASYHPGDRVCARVVSLTDYGAFVELEPGVEGLIHISEMSWSRRLRHPSKILNVGDTVDVGVLEVNQAKRRISLSLKAALADPWTSVGERFSVGSVVQGRVRKLADFGAFVEVEEGVDGLIHVSNLSWNKNIKHPSEVLKKGLKVEAVVLALDATNRRLSLGLKQLAEDPWQRFFSRTKVGDLLRGKITRLASFGAFVQLDGEIEGLCHVSEFADDPGKGGTTKLEMGGEYEFRVIRLNPTERKIGLSMKAAAPPPPPAETPKVREAAVRASTMAEALSSAGITAHEPTPSSRAGE